MECPECKTELGKYATYCGCGWKAKKQDHDMPAPRVKCCHDDCFITSFCKKKTPTGWADFCERHYLQYFQDQADLSCVKLGLMNADQKRAWLKTACLKLGARALQTKSDNDEIPF